MYKSSLTLLRSLLLLVASNLGPERLVVVSTPVIFGLYHGVTTGNTLDPPVRVVSSTSLVPLGEVLENTCLGHFLCTLERDGQERVSDIGTWSDRSQLSS